MNEARSPFQRAGSAASAERLHARVAGALARAEDRIRRLALDLHRIPERGSEEVLTVTRMAGELEEEGFTVTTGIGGMATAFRAERVLGAGGASVGLLAEYDAIPGLGHAAGHNLICAATWGAAVALAGLCGSCPGRIVVIGAPAEETFGGKVVLARRGVLDDLDVALLAHPWSEDRAIASTLASWSFEVTFTGRPAHAVVSPERGIDALDAMIRLFVARTSLVAEFGDGVSLPGVILEGGVRPNVVPDRARARFSLRAPTAEMLAGHVVPGFRRMAEEIARATGAGVELRPIDNLYEEMVPNPVLAELWARHARAAGIEPATDPGRPIGSLDIGVLSHRVPALHPLFAISDRRLSTHTRAFAAACAEPAALAATVRAAGMLAATAVDLFVRPRLMDRVRAAHEDGACRGTPAVEAPLVTGPIEP